MREITQADIDAAAMRTIRILDRPKEFSQTALFLGVTAQIVSAGEALVLTSVLKSPVFIVITVILSTVMWLLIIKRKKQLIDRIGLENAKLMGFSEKQYNELLSFLDIDKLKKSELFSDNVVSAFEERLQASKGYSRIFCLCNLISAYIQRQESHKLIKRAAELEAAAPTDNTEERERASGLFLFYSSQRDYAQLTAFFEENELLFSQKANAGTDSIFSLMAILGEYHYGKGDYEKALYCFEKCLEFEGNKLRIMTERSIAAPMSQQLNFAVFAVNCAHCCIESYKPDKAEEYLSKASAYSHLTPHISREYAEAAEKIRKD